MNGYECIRMAIQKFESVLLDEHKESITTVQELALITGYSPFHFTRLFSAITGITPKEYILGRMLSQAVLHIAISDRQFNEIAQSIGFSDYETFSRACTRKFSLSPSMIRSARRVPSGVISAIELPPQALYKRGHNTLVPTIVEKEAITLCGLRYFIEDGVRSFASYWANFMKVQHLIEKRAHPEVFYQYTNWYEQDIGGIFMLCGIHIETPMSESLPFVLQQIPKNTYLSFSHTGGPSSLYETYQYVYEQFISSSEYQLIDCWEFQTYPDEQTITIHIPIKI